MIGSDVFARNFSTFSAHLSKQNANIPAFLNLFIRTSSTISGDTLIPLWLRAVSSTAFEEDNMHYFTDSFVIRYISNKNKTNINITNTQTIPKIQNFKKAKDKIRNNVLNVKKINLKGVSEMK